MGFIVRIYNVDFENDFSVEYSQVDPLTSLVSGFTEFNSFPAITTTVEIPDLDFNTTYWIKLVDNVNDKTITKNVFTHDSKYYDCYDQIDFRVELSGDFCDLNVTVTLYDNIEPDGNDSSVIGGISSRYTLYRGENINSIFTGPTTLIGEFTTNTITKIIHQYIETEEVEYYLFLVHGDGFDVTDNKQGGFQVRKVSIKR